jgi:signal transduction histidine kinase
VSDALAPDSKSNATRTSRGAWRWASIIAVAAIALGLLASLQGYYQAFLENREPDFGRSLRVWMPDYLLWAVLAPAVLYLGRLWPVAGTRWALNLVRHLFAAMLCTLVQLLASVLIVGALVADLPLPAYGSYWNWYLGRVAMSGAWGVLLYFLVLAAGQAYDYYQRYRERELETARLDARASRLEAMLTETRLAALTARLQPHFLFNTLNVIAELIHREPDTAEQMIVRLGDLLRRVIDHAEAQWSNVAEEMEIIEAYLTLEQARYGTRLQTETTLDPDVLDAAIPSLTLQPLVENAIHHGIAPLDRPGCVRIQATRRDDRLRIEILDDGVGLDAERKDGVGLGTTRRRLHELYGGDFLLELNGRDEKGSVAVLEIPLRRAADEEPAAVGPGVQR